MTKPSLASLLLLVILAAPLALFASPRPADSGKSADQIQAEHEEDARCEAWVRHDWDAVGRSAADDLRYSHSTGKTQNKQDWLEGLRNTKDGYETMYNKDLSSRVYGDVAIVEGTNYAKRGGPEGKERAVLFISVYTRHNGRWLLSYHHSTSLPNKP
ncbi:MAG TPA: nuclear transport factor 2 family protein [Terriglobales bacterium]|jgi:hypothetical protein|nr:nuclear transport factor 2 family protein [Terriglobales bacterium]